MKEPIFKEGQVVRVKNPEIYFQYFAKKISDRDAIVMKNILDYGFGSSGNEKQFKGRVLVEFQQRNGRGKKFTEIMRESDLAVKEQS